MSPSFRRLLPAMLLTLVYWPAALLVIALGAMGDCYPDDLDCHSGKEPRLWLALAVEAAVYVALVWSVTRRRR